MKRRYYLITIVWLVLHVCSQAQNGASVYLQKPEDPTAVYFTPGQFHISNDGKTDVSDALQEAINLVKQKYNFGILFIPEGAYRISKTIYIPQAVRIIGYGKKRPQFILSRNSPGFQNAAETDKGKSKYMFWFTSSVVKDESRINDAGAGTFYSAMSNVNLKIEEGNPEAVALRTHYAQHSFASHLDVHIGTAKAGMFDVGNFMEQVRFFGGDYGIYTTKASPGWQFMMLDTYFEGQRKSAIKTQEGGLTIVRLQARNVPEVINVDSGYWEKLIIKDARFENIRDAALVLNNEENPNTQINLRNVACNNVPVFARYLSGKETVKGTGKIYRVKNFSEGLQMESLSDEAVYKRKVDQELLSLFPAAVSSDLPSLPAMSQWANLKQLGAIGDGKADDTKALQDAINKYEVIYLPQGWYRVSETIQLKPNTRLIGLHPMATQIIIGENTAAFGSFGGPKAIIESAKGGDAVFSGIGLATGQSNPRAVAAKWMAGPRSYFNDVKFAGGHGDMDNEWFKTGGSPYRQGAERLWDSQYWSLWITDGGGGVFKNIWTANTWANNGLYISNTSTPGFIYAMSLEHHVRNEARLNNVSNWELYAMQFEEESRESTQAQPLELQNCSSILFGNTYLFRVIRVNKPFPQAIRTWNCKDIQFLNVHNYAQTKYPSENMVYDIGTNIEVRPWELAVLNIKGDEEKQLPVENGVLRIATGFEFVGAMTADSKGNVFFAETIMKRIYKWDAATHSIQLLADFPWQPLALGIDKNDQLLVVFRYDPKPGYLVNGQPESFPNPVDAGGTSFSGWGNSGFASWVYTIDPDRPDESIELLKKQAMGSIRKVHKAYYPANRWRDFHDFNTVVVNRPAEAWVAKDGETIIPVVYDLARAASLVAAVPGRPLYVTDEYNGRTVRLNVDYQGYVSNLKPFAERGTLGLTVDKTGQVLIVDGQLLNYNAAGVLDHVTRIPEHPTGVSVGGRDQAEIFVTGYRSLFKVLK